MIPVRTIVIGIGNPVLCDDSVGLKVADRLRAELRHSRRTAVTALYAGGIRLMEAMVGYQRAILIDAIQTAGGRPGAVYPVEIADLLETRNICSTHDGSLRAALELGRMAGLEVPSEILIWAVEAADVETFSESLTPEVAAAVPLVVENIIAQLQVDRLPYQERMYENSGVFL